ncbi:MAG: hypothetical protein K8R99_15355 [Actinomycetia bacterium]|nr:hypothetical protein [Actinomycetes bacterium]
MVVAASLVELAERGVLSGVVARERTLSVLPAFESLLPNAALQRGSVVACEGSAASSLALGLAAGPSQAGAWVAVAGVPDIGLAAAVELGVVPARLVMVTEPTAGFNDATWADVLAAMIDGFDVLLLGPGTLRVRTNTARRLVARAQARGAVIVTVGANASFAGDLRFEVTQASWQGLGDGHGVAHDRRARVQLTGRRVPRPRHTELWLPTTNGAVAATQPAAESASVVALCPTG